MSFVRLELLLDRVRSSLFVVPTLFAVGGVALGEVMIVSDAHVGGVPARLTATVGSARAVLTTVAGATLTFAGIAFSISLLLISLASSQFSPRVVHGLFRDPFNTRALGIVLGTFTYCLTVMQAVRSPLEANGSAVVPSLSIILAVLLGVVSVLAIVAFINHAAHSMDVSTILHRVTDGSIRQVRATWSEPDQKAPARDAPVGEGFDISFAQQGWVQHIDHDALLRALDPGTCLQLETTAGRFAIPGTVLGTLRPAPADAEATVENVRRAVSIAETRTMQQDVLYGIRQLVDVALKALSPGINDPTTAQDAMFHLGAVVAELLSHPPPPSSLAGDEGRVLILTEAASHEEVIDLAFDEVRLAAAGQPTVGIYLFEILHLLTSSLSGDATSDAESALRRQADLTLEASELVDLPAHDHERVRTAYSSRFAPTV